jgi:hypothetical protein
LLSAGSNDCEHRFFLCSDPALALPPAGFLAVDRLSLVREAVSQNKSAAKTPRRSRFF